MDEETIKEWHEGWIKDCPNGKLDPKTFVAMYKEFFPTGPNAENFCTHVYRYVNYYFYVAYISLMSFYLIPSSLYLC